MKDEVDEINKILKEKFNKNIGDEEWKTIKVALQIISNQEKFEDMKYFSNKMTNEFDMNFINTY